MEKPKEGYHFIIDQGNHYAEVTANGRISQFSTFEVIDSVARHESFEPSFNVLINLIGMDYHPDYEEVEGIKRKLVEAISQYKGHLVIVCTPFVYPIMYAVSFVAKSKGLNLSVSTDYLKSKNKLIARQ